MGMSSAHVSSPDRRDRLWLINAFAVLLLTLLGASGEALGYDRHLKSNTANRRTHSLFRQDGMLYELIPNMPEHRLWPLIEKFAEMLAAQPVLSRCSVQSKNEGSHELQPTKSASRYTSYTRVS